MNTENLTPKKFRKEVHLNESVIKALQDKADNDGRSLMNYMEKVLIDASKNTQG